MEVNKLNKRQIEVIYAYIISTIDLKTRLNTGFPVSIEEAAKAGKF